MIKNVLDKKLPFRLIVHAFVFCFLLKAATEYTQVVCSNKVGRNLKGTPVMDLGPFFLSSFLGFEDPT